MLIPTECPSCNSTLDRVKDQLFCRNAQCPAQNAKVVENLCKKLKIKGFGPKTIEKLQLTSIKDLAQLNTEDMEPALGAKTAEKLNAELAKLFSVSFGTLLGALSIPLIGSVAGEKLGAIINSWEDVTKENCAKAGLGEKATDSLLNWMVSDQGIEVTGLLFEFEPVKATNTSTPQVENKGDVVITGKLDDFKNRGEAASFLEQHGYTVKTGVTKKTIALIVEDGSTSSKTVKANDLGVPILSIKELLGSN